MRKIETGAYICAETGLIRRRMIAEGGKYCIRVKENGGKCLKIKGNIGLVEDCKKWFYKEREKRFLHAVMSICESKSNERKGAERMERKVSG